METPKNLTQNMETPKNLIPKHGNTKKSNPKTWFVELKKSFKSFNKFISINLYAVFPLNFLILCTWLYENIHASS